MDTRGIARIFRDKSVEGAGFLVGETTVVTCAHVIAHALNLPATTPGKPQEKLRLDFPLLYDKRDYSGYVSEWWPRKPDGSGDIAVLTLDEAVKGVENVFFLDKESVWGREINVYGFPRGLGYDVGVWATARELGRNELQQTQIDSQSNIYLQPGFSGSPVWDIQRGGIVGMMVVADEKQGVAFMIPVETLFRAVPILPIQSIPYHEPKNFFVPYPRQSQFLGRESELQELRHHLTTPPAKTAALVGMGGIGKTTLAVQYAHQYRRLYPGGVYWFNAAGSLLHEFADLARKLEKATTATEETDAARQAWLHLKNQKDALLIFDDVDEPDQLKKSFAPGLTALDLPCWQLITSRKKSSFPTVEVNTLPEDTALQLLLRNRAETQPQSPEWHHAQAICHAVGHLPLALELIATFLTEYPDISFAGYHARLEKEKEFVLTDPDIIHRTPREISLEAVLQSQWKQVQKGSAQKVFLTAGQFPALDAIPLSWLGLLTGLPAEAEPGYPSPLMTAINELTNISLATRPQPETLHLHPLVREFSARQIPPADRDTFRKGLETHLLEALSDPEHRPSRALTAGELLLLLPWKSTLARLPVLEALREQMKNARTPYRQKLQAALHLTHLNWLEEVSRFFPALKAEEMLEYLELVVRVVRTPEPREAMILTVNGLLEDRQITVLNRIRAQLLVHRAGLYGYLQKYTEARQDYQKAQLLYSAELERSHNPEDHKTLARIYFGLAIITTLDAEKATEERKAQLIQEAIILFQQAKNEAEEYGKDKILEAIILRELSAAYLLQQNWSRAEECLTQAQARVAGNVFYETRISETFVERYLEEGKFLAKAGQPAEARTPCERALALARQNIETLLKLDPESEPLVVAYLLAGDCALALSQLTPSSTDIPPAREFWITAQTLANKLGDSKRAADAAQKLSTHLVTAP